MSVKKIGVEIEGGWNHLNSDFLENGVYRHDGSVELNHACSSCKAGDSTPEECGCDGYIQIGELAFQPQENINDATSELIENYPDGVNSTCGLHVHFSLGCFEYSFLVANYKRFYADYMKFLEYFGNSRRIKPSSSFWHRLAGESTYCRNQIDMRRINRQLENTSYDSSRYCHLNFCYAKHKTVEFRSACAFKDKRISADFVKALYDFVNMWLATNESKQKPLSVEVEI